MLGIGSKGGAVNGNSMKRIFLFVVTNLAVMLVLGVVASLLGVNRYLTANGLNLGALLGFSLVMGFGGAIISLLMSKPMAKWSTGAQVITQPQSADEAWIMDTVRRLSEKAGIAMPEVAIYEDRKSTRLNSSHMSESRMPSSA